MTALRRAAYPLALVAARLRRRGGRVALVGTGIAAGAAALALVSAGSMVIRDRSLGRAASELPAPQRAVQATWFGTLATGGNAFAAMDAAVRPQLARATGVEPVAAMLYREASIGGRLVDLRGVDDVGRWVHLLGGRLPRACTPARCEVLRLAGTGPLPSTPSLRLVQVGTATLRADAPFRDYVGRPPADTAVLAAAIAYHTPPPVPLVLAEGVDGLSRTPELSTMYRSYAWFAPLPAGAVRPWSVDRFRAGIDRLRSTIGTGAVGANAFDVTAPTDQLAAAASRGETGARRLLLLGGETAVLLLAFVLLAASSLRRDAEAARRRLAWAGGRRWQLVLVTVAESGAVAAAATLVGWGAGIGLGAIVARIADAPAGATLAHSAASAGGLALAAGLATAAALLLVLALRAPAGRLGGARLTALDAAALGALLAVAIGLARGGADPSGLAGGGTGVFLLLLPGLVAFVAAVTCARLLAPLLRGLERAGRRGPLSLRLAALSLARNRGRAAVAVAFLVVSLGLALFAAAYRSTLSAGQRDEAAFAVPADFVLAEDLSQLVPVTHVPTPPGHAVPVLRLSGGVSRLETSNGADVLGIPAAALPRIDGWRGDFADRPLPALAAAIRPAGPTALETLPLPPGARTLSVSLAGTGEQVEIRARVRLAGGDFATVRLGAGPHSGSTSLTARLPKGTRSLLGLDLGLINSGRKTANAGTGLQPTANGTLELRGLAADGRPLALDPAAWLAVGNAVPRRQGGFAYALATDTDTSIRLRQPTDGRPLEALVTPALAAAAGSDGGLPFEIAGERVVLHVAGVVRRVPGTTSEDVVVVDGGALSTALNALVPGLGQPTETWLEAAPGERAATARRLARPPYDVLDVRSRAAVEADLRADPLARGALLVLAGTALVALALAVAGLVLGLLADTRDEGGELVDLETQGASPALLRRHLRLRTLLVAVLGGLGGLATGAILSALVLALVRVTANVGDGRPPLRLALDVPLLAAGAGAFAALAALAVAVTTRVAFRARSAGRFREVGA